MSYYMKQFYIFTGKERVIFTRNNNTVHAYLYYSGKTMITVRNLIMCENITSEINRINVK
jgi:hypothetical protein